MRMYFAKNRAIVVLGTEFRAFGIVERKLSKLYAQWFRV